MGSPGPAKSRHNKREQRGPAEKLAGGAPGEGTRSGQAPARPAAWPPPRPPAGPPARGSRPRVAARPAGRVARAAAARCFRPAPGSPSPGSPDSARVPSPGGSPSRPLPGSFSNFLGRGRGDRGVGSASPAGLHGVDRATDAALAGTEGAPLGSSGSGVSGGAAGTAPPAPRPGAPRPGGGGADGVGSGARRDSPASETPRVAPAPRLKLYKE